MTKLTLFVVLFSSSLAASLHAQTIGIKLVNGKNGRPIAHTCVNVWVDHDSVAALAIPTDEEGIAFLRLTDKSAEINAQKPWKACGDFGVIDPVVKYGDNIGINAGYVICAQRKPDYSWLAIVKFPTRKVLQFGVVTRDTCGKATASPEPGQITLFVRPLTWWEKMKE